MTFLRICRPIYRLGVAVFWIGILLTGIGLVIGLFSRGWTALLIGISCVVPGIITSQIPVVYLGNEVQSIDESLTPKQVSDLVSRHLREHGDDADDTEVFLGKFCGEVEVVKKHQTRSLQSNPSGLVNVPRARERPAYKLAASGSTERSREA